MAVRCHISYWLFDKTILMLLFQSGDTLCEILLRPYFNISQKDMGQMKESVFTSEMEDTFTSISEFFPDECTT